MKTNFHHIKATLLATAVAFSLTACEDFFNEKPYGQLTTKVSSVIKKIWLPLSTHSTLW